MSAQNVLGSYSPESVTVVISNSNMTHTLSGFADGSMISVERVIPHATLYTGGDATNVRVTRHVKNCDITISLHQGSESNDVLSTLLSLDEQARNLDHLFSITIKDASGRSYHASTSAFIGTVPTAGYGVDIETRDWIISAINMDTNIGGNAKLTQATNDTLVDLGVEVEDYWKINP